MTRDLVLGAAACSAALVLAGCDQQRTPVPDMASTTSGVSGSADAAQPMTAEGQIAAVAEMLGIEDPPEVEPTREVTPAESKAVVDECVVERGWPMDEHGGFSYPEEQSAAFDIDYYVCIASYPIRQEYLQPLDDAAWSRIYDYWTTTTVPCLRDEGLEVAEPPTRETFLASRAWTPDDSSVRRQVEDLVAQGRYPGVEHVFTQVCPVSPPEDVRLGQ